MSLRNVEMSSRDGYTTIYTPAIFSPHPSDGSDGHDLKPHVKRLTLIDGEWRRFALPETAGFDAVYIACVLLSH